MISKTRTGLVPALLPWLAAFFFGAAVGGLVGHYVFPRVRVLPAREGNGTSRAQDDVAALGSIEPEGGVLTLGVPVPDRLLKFFAGIKEGDTVDQGKELAELESHNARKLDLELMQQQLKDAKAKVEAIKGKARAQLAVDEVRIQQAKEPYDVKQQQEQIVFLEKKLKNARVDLKRIDFPGSTVSEQEKEQQKLRVALAENEVDMAKDNLEKLKKTQELNIKAVEAQKQATLAEKTSALSEISLPMLLSKVKLAEEKLNESIVRAPSAGTILKIFTRPGELVGGQKPILQMADTRKMVVVAEVYETDIGRVKPGQKAIVTVRSRPKDFELDGTVIQVGKMVGENQVRDVDPTANVHRRVFKVKIRLGPNDEAAKRINQQVTVKLLVENEKKQ